MIRTQPGARDPGVVFSTRAAAQVVAPANGRVEFSGPFRSYGQMLILNVGDDILVVVSGMEAVFAEVGQRVLAGEPIGRMADRASPGPELYLEVRKSGKPVDAETWLNGG
jgi:septal ring factor EnvC (AmiA/AmiB activator)